MNPELRKLGLQSLGTILNLNPMGRDRVSRRVARYLDGHDDALTALPTVKRLLDQALFTISAVELVEAIPEISARAEGRS